MINDLSETEHLLVCRNMHHTSVATTVVIDWWEPRSWVPPWLGRQKILLKKRCLNAVTSLASVLVWGESGSVSGGGRWLQLGRIRKYWLTSTIVSLFPSTRPALRWRKLDSPVTNAVSYRWEEAVKKLPSATASMCTGRIAPPCWIFSPLRCSGGEGSRESLPYRACRHRSYRGKCFFESKWWFLYHSCVERIVGLFAIGAEKCCTPQCALTRPWGQGCVLCAHAAS